RSRRWSGRVLESSGVNRGQRPLRQDALLDQPQRRSEPRQIVEVEMVGHRMEKPGDTEGDETEPGSLCELSQVARAAAATDGGSSSRGGREAGREEGEKEAESWESEVNGVLEIDIVHGAPCGPDLLVEGQHV